MRILHISTGTVGGANIAAKRLATLQSTLGHDVFFHDSKSLPESRTNRTRILKFAILQFGRLITLLQQFATRKGNELVTSVSISQINLKNVDEIKPDIVHIHNWYNILSMHQIAKISQKYPVTMTLHDERLFTGGCHYTFGCKENLAGCHSCPIVNLGLPLPRYSLISTKKAFQDNSITLIAPSQWMFTKHEQNSLLRNRITQSIPNVINPIYFNSIAKKKSKSEVAIAFVAANPQNPIKGLNNLLDALDICHRNSDTKFKLVIAGEYAEIDRREFKIIQSGTLDEAGIRKLLIDADLCVVPSKQENFPNVVIESLLCGTPVIASNIGGMPEIIEHGFNGYISEIDSNSIANQLLSFFSLEETEKQALSQNARMDAETRFENQAINDRMILHYKYTIAEKSKS